MAVETEVVLSKLSTFENLIMPQYNQTLKLTSNSKINFFRLCLTEKFYMIESINDKCLLKKKKKTV